jgi:D-alanine-D-alanine ligase
MVAGLLGIGHPLQIECIQTADLEAVIARYCPDNYIVFNRCEELPGIHRSEYRPPQILENLGFTYTGADSQALILSQDKRRVKNLLDKCGIPTPAWKVYTTTQAIQWKLFPAIVKPAFEHCGYGISRESVVQSKTELVKRVQYVLEELNQPALVEQFIDGREFHVGAIGNERVDVLPPAEIDYSHFNDIHDRLCTYEANFVKTSRAYQLTSPKLPVDLTQSEFSQLEEIVLAAYKITGCRDYARMDVRLLDGVFYMLDVNHNSDISSETSLILAAKLVGLSYGQFGSLLVNLAAKRHPLFSSAHHTNEFLQR